MRVTVGGGDGGISSIPRTCKFIRKSISKKFPADFFAFSALDWSEADLPFYLIHAHFR